MFSKRETLSNFGCFGLFVVFFLFVFCLGYFQTQKPVGEFQQKATEISFCKDSNFPFSYTTIFDVLTLEVKKGGVDIELDMPIVNIPGVVTSGLAYQISNAPSSLQNLLIVIKNTDWDDKGRGDRIYCLDTQQERVYIAINDEQAVQDIMLAVDGITMAPKNRPSYISYSTKNDRRVLEIDDSQNAIDEIKIFSEHAYYLLISKKETFCGKVKNGPDAASPKTFYACASDGTYKLKNTFRRLFPGQMGNFFIWLADDVYALLSIALGLFLLVKFIVFSGKSPQFILLDVVLWVLWAVWMVSSILDWIFL